MWAFVVAVAAAAAGFALARRRSPADLVAERVRIAAITSEIAMFENGVGLYANVNAATGTLRDRALLAHAGVMAEAVRLKARGWPARESAVLLLRARAIEREVSAAMGLRSNLP